MKHKSMWKMLVILVVFVMIGISVAMPSAGDVSKSDVISSSTMIYVPDDYQTIQEAEDSANAGDTIIVRDGIYIENIDVKESHLTIKSENGSANCIVQAKDSNDPVFEVTADYVEINGFNVKGEEVGKQAIIKKEGGIAGIRFVYFSARSVCGGIDLGAADFCNISNNNISLGVIGISLSKSSNNNLINNTISNLSFGIYLVNSSNNILTNHRISHTNEGIFISSGNSNSLTNNNASSNSYDGILLLLVSNNNIITNNTVANNNGSGIYLGFSNNNTIYLNNFINNSDNVDSYNSTSIWNSKEKITYIYNEKTYTNYLGNYWSDYTGEDANKDGIGDNPYDIDSDKDNYPLMEPWERYYALPMPGKWTAFAEFGELVFIVNNSSTGISKISLNYSNWTCGGITKSGTMSISNPKNWPITNGDFTIKYSPVIVPVVPIHGIPVIPVIPKPKITIHGTFDETGTHVSGTLEEVYPGVVCSCAWVADYNSNEKSNTGIKGNNGI